MEYLIKMKVAENQFGYYNLYDHVQGGGPILVANPKDAYRFPTPEAAMLVIKGDHRLNGATVVESYDELGQPPEIETRRSEPEEDDLTVPLTAAAVSAAFSGLEPSPVVSPSPEPAGGGDFGGAGASSDFEGTQTPAETVESDPEPSTGPDSAGSDGAGGGGGGDSSS